MARRKKQENPAYREWVKLVNKQEQLIADTRDLVTIQGENWKAGQIRYYEKQLAELKANEPPRYK